MSYSNNINSIIAGTGILVTPAAPGTGANTVTISATGTQTLTVRTALTTPVTVTNSDDVVSVALTVPAATAVDLPAGVTGRVFNIKDGSGLAATTQPITITPNGAETIDGVATATINSNYGSVTLVFDGTQWLII